jgi:hypothetical protein
VLLVLQQRTDSGTEGSEGAKGKEETGRENSVTIEHVGPHLVSR